MRPNQKPNSNHSVEFLATLITMLVELRINDIPFLSQIALLAIRSRLLFELSGRDGSFDEYSASKAVVRVPSAGALLSIVLLPYAVEVSYRPAHLATVDPESADEMRCVLKIGGDRKIQCASPEFLNEFRSVWASCWAGGEEPVIGTQTYHELRIAQLKEQSVGPRLMTGAHARRLEILAS